MAARKLTVGDTLLVKVDPRSNNGADEAPAVVTRVLDVEGEDRVNLRVFKDGDEVTRLTNVQVLGKAPKEDDEDAPSVYAVRA